MHNDKHAAHRDIKADNIILDVELQLVIVDFGYAVDQNISKQDQYRGTKLYMAPEIVER